MEIKYSYDVERMEKYLRWYFEVHDMKQSSAALDIAIRMHSGQKRVEGRPYVVHPMMIASHAIAMGQEDDDLIAVMLLHDVCEDCEIGVDELPVNENVRHGVCCITKVRQEGESKAASMERYMKQLRKSKEACVAKLFDRCHNVSSMAGVFSRERMVSYIAETKKYIYPLFDYVREEYSEYAKLTFILEYHMVSVIDGLEAGVLPERVQ